MIGNRASQKIKNIFAKNGMNRYKCLMFTLLANPLTPGSYLLLDFLNA